MKKKNHNYILIILLALFLVFLYIIYKPYSYEKEYTINEYKIIEKYYKNNRYYIFFISKDNITYSFLIQNKYTHKRKLINNINVSDNCILPESSYLNFYPLCSKDSIVYTYNLDNDNDLYKYDDIEKANDKYNNISINYLNNKSYLLYNYRGFYLLNNKKEIKLFDKDVYNIDLIYYLNNYVIIPNYNENYYFDKFYIINMKTAKEEIIKLDNKISFDSVFLGDFKNNVYLLDKKEEKEYKINLNKKKIEETEFYILENNKLVKKNYLNIINNNLSFEKNNIYNYEIIDNNLYQIIDNNRIKISNLSVSKIVKIDSDTIYYLSKDSLYMYNNLTGEILLLSNFEWNFNNVNMIFISE